MVALVLTFWLVLAISAVAEEATFALPDAQVGVRYEHVLTLPSQASSLEVTGVPAGFVYSKSDRRLSGKPSLAKTYTLKVVAVGPAGKAAPVAAPLIVRPLPAPMQGRFFGVLSDSSFDGSVDITIAPTGAFSGKVMISELQGRLGSASFTGIISMDNGPAGVNPLPETFEGRTIMALGGLWKTRGPGVLTFAVGSTGLLADFVIPLKLDGVDDGEIPFQIAAMWCPWTARQPLPLAQQGAFNLGLYNEGGGGLEGPAGHGYARATVAAAGIMTLAGKLPDQTAITLSMPVDHSFGANYMVFLYGNRGSAYFSHGISGGSTAPDYFDAFVNGAVAWKKSPALALGPNYPFGFNAALSVQGGGKYLKPNIPILTGPLVMNLPENLNNTSVDVFGYTCFGTLGRNNTVKFGKTADMNPLGFTSVTFNAATGTFTGSAVASTVVERYKSDGTPYYVVVKKPFSIQGIVIRQAESLMATAMGYTVVPEVYVTNDPPYRYVTFQISYPLTMGFGM